MIYRNESILEENFKKKHEEFQKYAHLVKNANIIKGYLEKLDWKVKENSNTSFSLQGLNNYITSQLTKDFWLTTIYDRHIENHHREGDIHIHDLSMLAPYCVGWDLMDLIMKGFTGVKDKIHCSPPKHFRSALGQICNFLYCLQAESAGAQALSNFDTLLAPFIRYDKLEYKDVKQAMQEFIFQMNIPTRNGFQTPFSNLTFDLNCPSYFKDKNVFCGEVKNDKYKDFEKEIKMINKAFCEVMLEGDASGKVISFPIPTYNLTKDFNWDFPELWEMTSKYGIPYFSNFINSEMNPEDARSMCCRLRLDNRELRKGGMFGANPLTGSIGVVTINLPRIAYQSKNEDEFLIRLEMMMDVCKESLEVKRMIIEDFTSKGMYPYSKFYLSAIKEETGEYWSNHFSTIGIIGMNEAVESLIGENLTSEKAVALAKRILLKMRNTCTKFTSETGNNYNLEATPAEGTSHRLARLDKKKFGIKLSTYTNSSQLPVDYQGDVINAMKLQDEIQSLYTGGTVFHVFLGEETPDADSVQKFVKKVAENFTMPYFTITPTFSICKEHGYIAGEQFTCHCGKKCEVYSRIVGYLRPVDSWNEGKRNEYDKRKVFVI